jgi:hypothetical protein
LVRVSRAEDLIVGAFMLSGATLGTFLAMLIVTLGCDWLAGHLKATSLGTGWSASQRPIHPAREIFLPPLGCVMAYAVLAVLTWLPSIFQIAPAATWPWPVTWGAIGFGAMYLFFRLDEKLP